MRFDLVATDGQVVLNIQVNNAKVFCLKGIESAKLNSQKDARFHRQVTPAGHRFNLKDVNGKMIGVRNQLTKKAADLFMQPCSWSSLKTRGQ